VAFVFMVFHYPEPSHRDELLRGMAETASLFDGRPGFIEAGPWVEEGTDRVIGISRWESREAFEAVGLEIRPADEVVEGETRPRERFWLEEFRPHG
jgi:heme-degrading monooxygenase HmoA